MIDPNSSASSESRDPVVEMPESPVIWSEIFSNHQPVVLEIGSGKGLFLVNSARRNPHLNYLGVEIAKKYAYKAVERIKKARPAKRDDAAWRRQTVSPRVCSRAIRG